MHVCEEVAPLRSRARILAWSAAAAVAGAGCGKDEIHEYTAPKERFAAPAPATPAAVERPVWTLPSGWEERPGGGMRFATMIVEGGEPPLELRVTPLGLAARDALGNVNRWREQIGLGTIGPEQLPEVVRSLEVDGRSIDLVDLAGGTGPQAMQILAAILPGDQAVWFFMLMGPAERVGRHKAEFERFVLGTRLVTEPVMTALPEEHPPVDGTGPGAPAEPPGAAVAASGAEMTWTVPSGWRQEPTSGALRIATFRIADGGQTAEIAITKFPGGAGGVLENINRWRGQVGLAPVRDVAEQPMARLVVAQSPADRFDLVAPAASAPDPAKRERMIVLMLTRSDMTYFFKMTGANGLIEKHARDFDDFLKSVAFTGAGS